MYVTWCIRSCQPEQLQSCKCRCALTWCLRCCRAMRQMRVSPAAGSPLATAVGRLQLATPEAALVPAASHEAEDDQASTASSLRLYDNAAIGVSIRSRSTLLSHGQSQATPCSRLQCLEAPHGSRARGGAEQKGAREDEAMQAQIAQLNFRLSLHALWCFHGVQTTASLLLTAGCSVCRPWWQQTRSSL